MKLTLRLLTTICYFLPFTFFLTTCNNLEIKFSYNQAEADKNMALQEKEAKVEYSDSAVQYVTDSLSSSLIEDTLQDSLKKVVSDSTINGLNSSSSFSQRLSKFCDRIFFKVIIPTKNSLSGIGSILYFKNLLGKIVISISLLISLFFLFAFKFLNSPKTKVYLQLMALVCHLIFIIDSIVSNVALLWGSWTLLILLIVQIIVEFIDKMKTK